MTVNLENVNSHGLVSNVVPSSVVKGKAATKDCV